MQAFSFSFSSSHQVLFMLRVVGLVLDKKGKSRNHCHFEVIFAIKFIFHIFRMEFIQYSELLNYNYFYYLYVFFHLKPNS